jgi:hypothetical protein
MPNGGQINLIDAGQVTTPNLSFASISIDSLPTSDSPASGTGDMASGTTASMAAAPLSEGSTGTGELLDGVLPPTAAGQPNPVADLAPEIETPVAQIAMTSTVPAQTSTAAPAQVEVNVVAPTEPSPVAAAPLSPSLSTPVLAPMPAPVTVGAPPPTKSTTPVAHQAATPSHADLSQPDQAARTGNTVPVVVATIDAEAATTSGTSSTQIAMADTSPARDVVQTPATIPVATARAASGNGSGGSLPGPLGMASAALVLLGAAAWSRKAKLLGSAAARAAKSAAAGSSAAADSTGVSSSDKPKA